MLPFSASSYHLEIIPPEGVDIYDFKFNDLENTYLIQNKRKKDRYFDKELLYISFSPEETKEIDKKIYEDNLPAVTLVMRINPLLCWLYRFVHLAVLLPLLIKILINQIGISEFIASLALGATIFVSASIYAIDKKVVQKFALFQLFVACILLIIESIILIAG